MKSGLRVIGCKLNGSLLKGILRTLENFRSHGMLNKNEKLQGDLIDFVMSREGVPLGYAFKPTAGSP